MSATPYYREAGAGPSVLCVHSTASNSRQYLGLMDRLAPDFRVIAPDLFGHGQNHAWAGQRRFTLADEAAPLEALLPEEPPVHLVGHSYGGAVALRIATANRSRVRSLVLYEPAIWGTLVHFCPDEPGTREIEAVRDETIRLIDAGDLDAAAECFIDYWGGAGSWAATPGSRRPRMLSTLPSLRHAWLATFIERWTPSALRSLDIPCLLLTGTRSTTAARRAVQLLSDALPRVTVVELEGLGHLGPITHPQPVIDRIETFLWRMREPARTCDSRRPIDQSSHYL